MVGPRVSYITYLTEWTRIFRPHTIIFTIPPDGFEPPLEHPKCSVLPLDERGITIFKLLNPPGWN